MKNIRSTSTIVPSYKSRLGIVVAKDGGWGWVIVIASFMVYVLSIGVLFSLGILATEIARYFNAYKGATAWVISIAIGVNDCLGPIISGLTNKYGCRPVAIAGALLSCTGMLISIPAQSVVYLFFTFSPIVGMGVGMMVLPSLIIVNSYFEKKRALATGISTSGMSFGTLLMPPTIEAALTHFGSWRSTLLILAGIILNAAVFGSLYRPPDNWIVPAEDEDSDQDIVIFEPIPEAQEIFLDQLPEKKSLYPESVRRTESEPNLMTTFIRRPIKRAHSLTDLDDLDVPESIATKSSLSHHRPNTEFATSKTTARNGHSMASHQTPSQRTHTSQSSKAKRTVSGLLYRKDIFYSASLHTVPEYRDNAPEFYQSIVTTVIDFDESRKWYGLPVEILHALQEMMGLSLLRDRAYQVILMSRFIASLGVVVPYIYIADRAVSIGIANGSWLVSIMSTGTMAGKLGAGLFSDRKSVNRVFLYKMLTAVCGITITGFSGCYSFFTMAIVSSLYGFTLGAYSAIVPIVLVDVLGIAKLTNAYGLVMCSQGIASIIGLPVTGMIYDQTGSYAAGFIFSGVLVILSSLVSCFIPVFARQKENKLPVPRSTSAILSPTA